MKKKEIKIMEKINVKNNNKGRKLNEIRPLLTEKANKDEFAKNLMELIFGKHLDEDYENLNQNLMSNNYFIVISYAIMDMAKTHSESIIKLMLKDGLSEVEVAEKLQLTAEKFLLAKYKEIKKLRCPSLAKPLREFLLNNNTKQ